MRSGVVWGRISGAIAAGATAIVADLPVAAQGVVDARPAEPFDVSSIF